MEKNHFVGVFLLVLALIFRKKVAKFLFILGSGMSEFANEVIYSMSMYSNFANKK